MNTAVELADDSNSKTKSRNRFAEAALQFLRLVLVALVIGAGIFAGLLLPYVFRATIASVPDPGGLVFGIATVMAVVKDLLKSLPVAVTYIAKAGVDSLAKLFAEIAVAALGLGVAWYSGATTPPPSGELLPPSLNLSIGSSLPPIILNEGGALFATYLIFAEDSATLENEDRQLVQISALVTTLAQCIQSSTDEVDLLVRAYASSSGTDADNTKLYKDRGTYTEMLLLNTAQAVAPSLRGQFKIQVRDWPSLELMKARRLFKDTDAQGKYLEGAGGFNRRAEILVRSAGSCLSG